MVDLRKTSLGKRAAASTAEDRSKVVGVDLVYCRSPQILQKNGDLEGSVEI